jgi:putative addiction module component (TIGR02574 family)
MSSADEIFNAAQLLSPHDQWQLVARLWQSLPPEAIEIDERESELLDRRMAELESGKVEAIPGEEVRRYLRSWIQRNG